MNILMTNDDGIDSEGIQKLAGILRSGGKHKVFMIAPHINRSGISNAIALINEPVKLSAAGENTWSCSGYPADCIIIALKGFLSEKPDLVISGINRGPNLGTDVIYSGTASAARQASLAGVPAIALSLAGKNPYYWDTAAAWSSDHLEELLAYWKEGSFLNVNIPNGPGYPEGVATASLAIKDYQDYITIIDTPDGKQWCFMDGGEEIVVSDTGSDFFIVSRNYVSVSSINNYPMVINERQFERSQV